MITQQDIDNIDIRYVVILDSDEAGDLYMEKMYPLWCDVVVLTVDGKYPTNPMLKQRVLTELETNENIYCLIWGAKDTQLKIATKKRLFLADFLIRDLALNWEGHSIFDFDEFKIIDLCMTFCNVLFDRSRIQNFNVEIDKIDPRIVKWFHQLMRA